MLTRKPILCVLFVLLCGSTTVFAQQESVVWGSWYSPGNLAFTARGAFETPRGYSSGVGVYPGAEIILYKPPLGTIAPLDFGAAVRGHFGLGFDRSYGNASSAGVGGFATMHLGFRGVDFLDAGFVEKLEYFAELGLSFDIKKYSEGDSGLHLSSMTGLNYFLTESLAISAGYNHWGSASGGFLGLQYKIGPSPHVDSTELAADFRASGGMMMTQVYVSQFYAIYWYAFAPGGFYFDDSTYEVGQGTVWSISSSDSDDEFVLEKALLSIEDDGSKWWRVAFNDQGERLIYEYHIDSDHRMIKMRFKDVAEEKVGEHEFEPGETTHDAAEVERITREDYSQYRTGSETIRVGAGSFDCDVLEHSYSDDTDSWEYSWWISEEVPGSLVKFYWELNDTEEWMEGELIEITTGNRAELR